MVLSMISIGEIDNILAQFLAYIGLHPARKSHHGIISMFLKYPKRSSGVKVIINVQGKYDDFGNVEVLSS